MVSLRKEENGKRGRCHKWTLLLVAFLSLVSISHAESSISLNGRRGSNSPVSNAAFASRRRRAARSAARLETDDESATAVADKVLSPALRGGGAAFNPSNLGGAAYFVVLDVVLRKLFARKSIKLPSMMGGTIIMFVALLFAEFAQPGLGESAFQVLNPGATLLAKWLPVFFVPGLVMLPLAPKVGSGIEVVKMFAVVLVGWLFTMLTTAYTVLGVRTLEGKIAPATATEKSAEASTSSSDAAAAPRPFSAETLRNLSTGTVVFGVLATLAARASNPSAVPLQTIFMACATIGSFVYGARLPPSFTAVVHPLVTSTVATLALTRLSAAATGKSFDDTLRMYKSGTLAPSETGAGDLLLFLLGPSVISLSIPMYSRKTLMRDNLSAVLLGNLVSAVGGLFGTAAFVRLLRVSSDVLKMSCLPRNVTTALAMAIADLLGGDISITASIVVFTGILGATIATRFLTSVLGVVDPVTRGLATGCSSQGLGVASIVGEKDAFPFAAIGLVLNALFATGLASVERVQTLLRDIAGVGVAAAAATDIPIPATPAE